MAQYYEDFRDAALDSVPSDFSLAWGGLPLDFTVKSGNILPDSDRHLLLTASGGNFQRLALRWGVGNTSGKTTVRCLLEFDPLVNTTTRAIPGAFLSGSGNQSSRTGYVQWFGTGNRISKYSGGSDSTIATETLALSPGMTTRYLEISRDGGTIETRQWPYGSPRPELPDLTVTDGAELPVDGFFGLSYLPGGSSLPSKLLSIAAGTNGDTAPTGPIPAGGADVELPPASASSVVNNPTVSAGASVSVPTAAASADLYSPMVTTAAGVELPTAFADAQSFNIEIAGGAEIALPAANAGSLLYPVDARTGVGVLLPAALAQAMAYNQHVASGAAIFVDTAYAKADSPDLSVSTGEAQRFVKIVRLAGIYRRSIRL